MTFPYSIPKECWNYIFDSVSNVSNYAHLKIDMHLTKHKRTNIGSTARDMWVFTSVNYPLFLFAQTKDTKKDGSVNTSLVYRMKHITDEQLSYCSDPQELFNDGLTCQYTSSIIYPLAIPER